MKDKRIFLGNYTLGIHHFRVYADPYFDGGKVRRAEDKGSNEIIIGLDYHQWPDVLSTLLHEAFEAVAMEIQTRWTPSPSWSDENANFLFIQNHNQFDETTMRVGWFMAKVIDPLKAAWEKDQKRKAEEAKKKDGKLRTNRRVASLSRGRSQKSRRD